MTQLLLDKHTIDLLERLVIAAENNQSLLEKIETTLDTISVNVEDCESRLNSIEDDISMMERMLENSESI